MRTKAKIEAEITALASEVSEVARQRGAALPTPQDLAEVIEALGVSAEAIWAARQPGEDEDERFAALFTPGEVAPSYEALCEAYGNALGGAVSQDRSAYEAALRELRPVLREVLVRNAERWARPWAETSRKLDLYWGAKSWLAGVPAPPAEAPAVARAGADWATQVVAKAKGWHLILLAARALHLAHLELQGWREWVTGGAVKWHASYQSERVNPNPSCSEDPALLWAREVAKHTLPDDEESALVQRGVVTAEALAAVKALAPIPSREAPTN